jgi:hypothetical protein
LWVVSPFAKKGPVKSSRPAEHTSTLKADRGLHGLPTLTSRNPRVSTRGHAPTGGNCTRRTAHSAPPRDGQQQESATCSTCFDALVERS